MNDKICLYFLFSHKSFFLNWGIAQAADRQTVKFLILPFAVSINFVLNVRFPARILFIILPAHKYKATLVNLSSLSSTLPAKKNLSLGGIVQGPVVERADSAILRINRYPVDK